MKNIAKAVLTILLVATVVLAAVSVPGQTDATTTTVDGIEYSLSDSGSRTATVTQSSISSMKGDVVIPSSITYNGKTYTVDTLAVGFANNANITSVTLPDSIMSLPSKCFYACSSLKSATMNGVLSINSQCFYTCGALTKVSATSATAIQASAFDKCKSLSSVDFGELTEIGNYAFRDCSSLTSFDLPETAGLGIAPFVGTGITKALISGGVLAYVPANIGSYTIPSSVTTIGSGAFYNVALNSLDVPSTVMTVADYGFYCSDIKSINFDKNVMGIGNYAFADTVASNSVLKSVTLPTAITIINEGTFSNCGSLETITIPKEINAIGERAFEKCSSLKSVNVSSAINYGARTFANCKSLESFSFYDGSVAGANMFAECESLKSVKLCDSMTDIPDYMLYKCRSLTSFDIPAQVKTIGKYALSGTSITELTIPATLNPDGIGDQLMRSTSSLKKVTFLGSYAVIPIYCFHSCTNLKTIETYGMLEVVNFNAFLNCNSLNEFIVHSGVPFKDDTMFKNSLSPLLSNGYLSVKVPSGSGYENGKICVTASSSSISVGSDCVGFSNSALAKTVGSGGTISSSNTSIVCSGGAVYLDDELLYISPSASSPVIRDGTERIDALSMCNLSNARIIAIPGSVEKVDSYAISSNSNLRSVLFYGSPVLDIEAISLGDAKAYFLDGGYDASKCGDVALSGFFAEVSSGRVIFTINDPVNIDFTEIHSGNDIAFSVTPYTGYTDSAITATSNGSAVPIASSGTIGGKNISGMYVLKGVSGDTEVVISGIELNLYDVRCPSGTGYAFTISESKGVVHGSEVLFQVRCLPGYQFSPSYYAQVDGVTVQADTSTSEYRVYSFDILHDTAITVSGITEKSRVTVTFNTDGGSSVNSQSVLKGASATVPNAPTKSGCTFLGWYTSPACTDLYDFGAVESNTTVYAKWASQSASKCTLTLSAQNGKILAYVNGSTSAVSSGASVVSGSTVNLVYVPSEGYESTAWYINGQEYGPASSREIVIDSNTTVSIESTYYATGSFINSTSMDTPTPSDYVSSWMYGTGGTAGASFKNMVYAPAVIGGYVYAKNDNILLKIDADDGTLVKSVKTAPSFSGFYEYVAVGGNMVLDCITGKVFDTDLNQIFVIGATTAKAFYHDGYFYVETSNGTACYKAEDADPSNPTNAQRPVWTMDTGSFVTLYEGGTQMLFHNGFIMVCGFVESEGWTVYLQTSDAKTGEKIDRIYIPEFKGQYSNKGYIDIGEGYATVTTYLTGIFDAQKGKIYNVASVKIDENGVFDHASLKVRSNGDRSSYSSAMIINDGLGYVFSDGTFTVYDLETMDVVATMENRQLYAHGSMAISTGHSGKVYAYIVPYTESTDLLVVEYNLKTNALSFSKMENVAAAQYSSQQIHFLEDGAIIYTNDNGKLYCIRHNVAVSSITLSERSKTIGVGEEFDLEASFSPSNAGIRTLEWTTSDSDIATVDNGTVTGVSKGTVTITAKTTNGRTATCSVTVGSATVPVSSVTLDKSSASIGVGDTVSLRATVLPSDATDRSVTWSTSDSGVATVQNGLVKGVSPGTATITVATASGSYKASCEVTVSAATYTITWKDWDGRVLSTSEVNAGVVPSYDGDSPTRNADARYSYAFSGWSPSPVAAVEDAVYTATYRSVAQSYTVTYLPGDHGTFDAQTYTAAYGAQTPSFSGTPAGVSGYTFSSWSPAVSSTVTGNATYTAQWSSSEHSVRYLVDGVQVGATEAYAYGDFVKVRAAYEKTGYEVSAWESKETIRFVNGGFLMPDYDVTFEAATTPIQLNIIWLDWNEDVLYKSVADYGSTPVYNGEQPTRDADDRYSYTFSGWNPSISAVTSDTTYVATYKTVAQSYTVKYLVDGVQVGDVETYGYGNFVKLRAYEKTGYEVSAWESEETIRFVNGGFLMPASDVVFEATSTPLVFEITWKNWDRSELGKSSVAYGVVPSYDGDTPTRPSDSSFNYSFIGWTPTVAKATGNATYTATFVGVPVEAKTYQITWKNWDDTVLATTEVAENSVPSYVGTPVKESDGRYSYTFSGWEPSVVAATSDATYKAAYDETAVEYTVRYLVDGVQIGDTETHAYNETVKLRADYEKTGYEVSAWESEERVYFVNGAFLMPDFDVTFEATTAPIVYKITWNNWDGTALSETDANYGSMPSYDGKTPVKESDDSYSYAFSGWNPAVVAAYADATYTASFEAVPIYAETHTVTYLVDGVQVGDIETHAYNERVKLRTYEKTGYEVSAWESKERVYFVNGAFLMPDCDVTFEATTAPIFFTIQWLDWDGSLLAEDRVAYGSVPSYSGDTPVRPDEGAVIYAFIGWEPTIVAAYDDATYTAAYASSSTDVIYRITWMNWDGEFMNVTNVKMGYTPNYYGPDPIKPSDELHEYELSGWEPAIVPADSNATYTAVYSPVPPRPTYTITWNDWDGSTLRTTTEKEGLMPIYYGKVPTRESDASYSYTFSGWSPAVTLAESDATYTATYTSVAKSYTVKYMVDGVQIGDVETHSVGDTVKLRDIYVKTGYDVSAWKSAETVYFVNGGYLMPPYDVTYTATATPIVFDIAWKNWDGSTLAESTANYGATPSYSGSTPQRAADDSYSYSFAGWSPAIGPVTSDMTYTAEFTAVPVEAKTYQITWKNWDGTVLATSETAENALPAYAGGTPAKESDERYSYTFSGWEPAVVEAVSDAEYTATYSETAREYSVKYLVDGIQIGEAEAHAFNETVKLRDIYEKTGYDVSAWESKETVYFVNGAFLMPAHDVTFEATSTPLVFEIVWKNWNGSSLGTSSAEYGTVPEYSGSVPTRASDGAYDYSFSGWSPSISAATSDATYTATYDATKIVKHVTGITIDSSSLSLAPGETGKLVVTVTPADASDASVIWSSSDESVAKVDQNGNVTAVADGTAKITATTADGGYSTSCDMTVKTPSQDNTLLLVAVGAAIVLAALAALFFYFRRTH